MKCAGSLFTCPRLVLLTGGTPVGTYTISVTATSGNLTHTATVTPTVE